MLINFLVDVFVGIVSLVLALLPNVSELPFGIDSYLVQGRGMLQFLANEIPIFAVFISGFLWIMSWKLSLIVLTQFRILKRIK